jgi:hypothetical protein
MIEYLPPPPFEVYCADDTNRPNEIPLSKWIRKGLWYTVIAVTKHNNQQGLISFTLEEIDLSDCQPYITLDEEQDILKQ